MLLTNDQQIQTFVFFILFYFKFDFIFRKDETRNDRLSLMSVDSEEES